MSHAVTIQFDRFGYGPDYSMTCKAPTAAPCHIDYGCSCGAWGETGVEGGRPWHESYGGERHYGTYDPTTCGVRDSFENSEDLAELIKGSTQFSVQPEWEGEWYEYRIIETAPVDPTLPLRTADEWVQRIDSDKLAGVIELATDPSHAGMGTRHVGMDWAREMADAVLAALPELMGSAS